MTITVSNRVATTIQFVAGYGGRCSDVSRPLGLRALLDRLSHASSSREALRVEDDIWRRWMAHPNAKAACALDKATDEIAIRLFDIAETRLTRLVLLRPDYAEAWHKLGTLHYLMGRDEESLGDYRRALELEPRHFSALCSMGEILLFIGHPRAAAKAFRAVLQLHPHHRGARRRLNQLRHRRSWGKD